MLAALLCIGAGLLGACSNASYSARSARYNDLYTTHDKQAIQQEAAQQAAQAQACAEAQQARIAALLEQAYQADEGTYMLEDTGNPYTDVLADDYQSAYARRLKGFSSSTYQLPSSYYSYRYSSAYPYVNAYDPAFYNVIIMGDEVWVEPKYVSAMFGTWGNPTFNLSFGLGWPYYNSWRWNYYYGWGPNWGWYDPWWGYYPPYWYPGWYPGPGHGHGYRPVDRRPTYATGNRGSMTGGGLRPTLYNNNSGSSSSGRPTTVPGGYRPRNNNTTNPNTNRDPNRTYNRNDRQPSRPATPAPSYNQGSITGGSYGGGVSRGGGTTGGSRRR